MGGWMAGHIGTWWSILPDTFRVPYRLIDGAIYGDFPRPPNIFAVILKKLFLKYFALPIVFSKNVCIFALRKQPKGQAVQLGSHLLIIT
jgi:hypothetical protein